jgi:serine/threonine-protein kinase
MGNGSDERSELRGIVLESRYQVGATIGIGGTGVVFEATRLEDGATVVIKTLRERYAHNPDLVHRLRREAEVPRNVAHPGLLPIFDEGVLPDGSPFIVMPKAGGESLAQLIHRYGTLGAAETAAIAIRTAAILHAVHRAGYVHRDVKPEHVLLDRDPSGGLIVQLLDFGVCASETASEDERDRERGRVYGTPSYVSPEQACGNPDVDGRADVYGLGVLMFEALTGRLPFRSKDVTALLRRIIAEDPPRPVLIACHVSAELDAIIARAMARDMDERYPSMRGMARALVPHAGPRVETERRLASTLAAGTSHSDSHPTVVAAA